MIDVYNADKKPTVAASEMKLETVLFWVVAGAIGSES
jgi:hypothetical protein